MGKIDITVVLSIQEHDVLMSFSNSSNHLSFHRVSKSYLVLSSFFFQFVEFLPKYFILCVASINGTDAQDCYKDPIVKYIEYLEQSLT